MTLPNKLTLLRIILVPVMVIIAFIPYLNNHYMFNSGLSIANFINLIIFAIASFTDFLDGKIARKFNLVTTFGKFADPLADKMLVLTSFLILMYQGVSIYVGTSYSIWLRVVPLWGVAIILLRELMVSGIRLVAAERGEVIAAGWSGKVKTFFTMFAIIVMFFAEAYREIAIAGVVMMYISIILTIYSGLVYLIRARKIIFESI